MHVPLPGRWSNGAEVSSPQLPAAAGDTGVRDSSEWWRVFQDPALDRLQQAAMKSNLTMAAAREHLRAAQALVPVADSPFRPNLSASTGSDTTPDATRSYFQASLAALWELPVLSRGDNARRATAARADAAAA